MVCNLCCEMLLFALFAIPSTQSSLASSTSGSSPCLPLEQLLNATLVNDVLRATQTVTGQSCQPWKSSGASGGRTGSFCHYDSVIGKWNRPGGAWCETSDGGWNYCFSECAHDRLECLPSNALDPRNLREDMRELSFVQNRWPKVAYRGRRNTTLSGKECRPWKEANFSAAYEQFPGNLCYDNGNRYEGDGRTSVNDQGPWCFTELSATFATSSWDYCFEHCQPPKTDSDCIDEASKARMRTQFYAGGAKQDYQQATAVFEESLWGRTLNRKRTTAAGATCEVWSRRADLAFYQNFGDSDNICRTTASSPDMPVCPQKSGYPERTVLVPCFVECNLTSSTTAGHWESVPGLLQGFARQSNRTIETLIVDLLGRKDNGDILLPEYISIPGFRDQFKRRIEITAEADGKQRRDLRICNPHQDGEFDCLPEGFRADAYRGTRAKDRKGRRCLYWNSVTQSKELQRERHRSDEANFCRNPDKDRRGPWCFVNITGRGATKSPCFKLCAAATACKRTAALQRIQNEADLPFMHPIVEGTDQQTEVCGYSEANQRQPFQDQKASLPILDDRLCRAPSLASVFLGSKPSRVPVCRHLDNASYEEALATATSSLSQNEKDEMFRNATSRETKICFESCEDADAQLTNIPTAELFSFEYNGRKSRSVDGSECIHWPEILNRRNWEAQGTLEHLPTDQKMLLVELLSPDLDNNHCLNLIPLIDRKGSALLASLNHPGIASAKTSASFVVNVVSKVRFNENQLQGPWCFVAMNVRNRGERWMPEPCFPSAEALLMDLNDCLPSPDDGPHYQLIYQYNGRRNKTTSGEACASWFEAYGRTKIAGLSRNFCSNPDNHPIGPWCFVERFNKKTRAVQFIPHKPCFKICKEQGTRFNASAIRTAPETTTKIPRTTAAGTTTLTATITTSTSSASKLSSGMLSLATAFGLGTLTVILLCVLDVTESF